MGSNKEFVRYLFISRASAGEVRSQLYLALDLEYLSMESFEEVRQEYERLSRQIATLARKIRDAEDKYRLREPAVEYPEVSSDLAQQSDE